MSEDSSAAEADSWLSHLDANLAFLCMTRN